MRPNVFLRFSTRIEHEDAHVLHVKCLVSCDARECKAMSNEAFRGDS